MKSLLTILAIMITIPSGFTNDYLDHFSVNTREVSEAVCRRDFFNNPGDLQKKIHEIAGQGQTKSEEIYGIQLSNEKIELIGALKKLFTRRGYNHPKDFIQPQVDIREDLAIKDCDKVICVLKRVWGEERGLKILWIMLKYGFNTSEYAYDDSESPTNEELDDIISSLDLLPPNAKDILYGKNIPFLAFKNITGSQQVPASSVLANSNILFFSSLRIRTSESRIQVFLHELGHLYSNNGDSTKEWLKVSGWGWDVDRSSRCAISRYGMETSGEDFAETFNMYRLAPKRLKKMCPQKYEFMKNVVFQIEYNGTRSCGHT